MAQVLSPNEIFYTSFEPKKQMQFIMYVDGIPSFMINKVDRPSFGNNEIVLDHINVYRKIKGKTRWNDITMTLYDPITPSGAQVVMEWQRLCHESVTGRDGYSDFYKKDVTINVLGPVGDVVEEWIIKGAFIKDAKFGTGEWASDTGIFNIELTLAMDYCILNY